MSQVQQIIAFRKFPSAIHGHVHKIPPMGLILSQMNAVYTSLHIFLSQIKYYEYSVVIETPSQVSCHF